MTWSSTLRFKFPSKDQFRAMLPVDMKGSDGEPLDGGDTFALAEIGLIMKSDGTALDGWHVDLRLNDGAGIPHGWQGFEIQVNNPKHEFA